MTTILEYASGNRLPFPGQRAAWWWARVWYALGGVILPVFCWIVSFGKISPPVPNYQSEHWTAWVGLCLSGQVAWPLFPFIGGSVLALLLLLIHREFFAHFLIVRLAVYTGLLQALLFTVFLTLAFARGALLILIPSGVALMIAALAVGLWLAIRTAGGVTAWGFGGLMLALAVVAVLAPSNRMGFGVAFIGGLLAGPFAMALAFASMSFWLWRHPQMESTRVGMAVSIGGWIAGYAAGWFVTATNAIDAYAALPKTRPGCYIATVAAQGHPRFVGTSPVVMSDGSVMLVNRQLRVLKCGELLLRAFFPRLHAACRAVYDRLGPPLAACLSPGLVADAAYVGLKPLEWPTWLVLRVLSVDGNRIFRG